jgi:hypothetical protein
MKIGIVNWVCHIAARIYSMVILGMIDTWHTRSARLAFHGVSYTYGIVYTFVDVGKQVLYQHWQVNWVVTYVYCH